MLLAALFCQDPLLLLTHVTATVCPTRSLQAWLTANCPSIRDTLLPGATLEELAQAEQLLGAPFPPALRALYGWVHVHTCMHIRTLP